jgi:hypothetical protein
MRIKASILILALCLTCITCSDGEKPVQYDKTVPEVLSTEPANGVTNVHENDSIVVTFSECIDPASVTAESFLLNGGDVLGNAYGSNNQAVFVPTESLQHDSTYTVTLTTAITDCSGNPIDDDFVWTFTIRERPKTVVYFCSFESAEDSDGWWYAGEGFTDDAPPGCGSRSFQMGGCIYGPSGILSLRPEIDGYYVFSCWARILMSGSRGIPVVLTTSPYYDFQSGPKIRIDIIGDTWSFYETTDSLYCSDEDSLYFEVWSGGDPSGTPPALIDCLSIERLDQ